MNDTQGLILWDFDGRVAFRRGLWSACLLEILNEQEPRHSMKRDHLVPFLRDTFPWHHPECPHLELNEPREWWKHVEGILSRAFEGVGYQNHRARELAALAHERYIDRAAWQLFDDTLPVLVRLTRTGWRHGILSNHVPELSSRYWVSAWAG